MASYRYTVTVQEPRRLSGVKPDPIAKTFDGDRLGEQHIPSARAIEYARAQHRRPDGTTITITRRKVYREVNGRDLVGEREPELVYRRYEVQGGVVRRTDR